MDNKQREAIKKELKLFSPPLCEDDAPSELWYNMYWLIDAIVHDDTSIDTVILDALWTMINIHYNWKSTHYFPRKDGC